MNMYILIYINCTEGVWGMHVRWNYPPCIRRRNKGCLPFNTALVLRGFIPGFLLTTVRFSYSNGHYHSRVMTSGKLPAPLIKIPPFWKKLPG